MHESRYRRAGRFAGAALLCAALASTVLAEPWTFIAVGDSRGSDNGVNLEILSELASEIVSQAVDLVVFPGDLVTGGVDQAALEGQLLTWRDAMQPVYDAGIAVYPVRGNHDLGDPAGTTAWNNVFSGPYALPQDGPAGEENLTYAVVHENALFLGLDEYVTRHRVNQTWINAQLASSSSPHLFVFGHEPAFKVEHTDCLDDYPVRRNTFWASLANAGGRTYFCGHDHFYDHADVDDDGDPNNDVHQYVVGTAGAPPYDWSGNYDGNNDGYTVENIYHAMDYGYVLGEIDGLNVTLTWMQRVGANAFEAREQWSYTAVAVCFGDLSGDGRVGLPDLAILLSNYGLTGGATYEQGDLDGDADVDLTDLATLLGRYGTVCW